MRAHGRTCVPWNYMTRVLLRIHSFFALFGFDWSVLCYIALCPAWMRALISANNSSLVLIFGYSCCEGGGPAYPFTHCRVASESSRGVSQPRLSLFEGDTKSL